MEKKAHDGVMLSVACSSSN